MIFRKNWNLYKKIIKRKKNEPFLDYSFENAKKIRVLDYLWKMINRVTFELKENDEDKEIKYTHLLIWK